MSILADLSLSRPIFCSFTIFYFGKNKHGSRSRMKIHYLKLILYYMRAKEMVDSTNNEFHDPIAIFDI